MNKLINKLLLLCVIACSGFSVHAQGSEVQIGSGTTTTNLMPINYLYNYTYTQQIVLASEITAGGGHVGNITKIKYFWNSGTSMTQWNQLKVYLGNTNKTEFTSTTDWVQLANLTQVFDGVITGTVGNWIEISFTTPFNYTGGNLVIAVDENAPSYISTTFLAYNAVTNRGTHYRSDSTNPTADSPPTATGRVTSVPQLKIVIDAPITGTIALGAATPSCTNGVELVANVTTYAGFESYWQSSPTGTSTANPVSASYFAMANQPYYIRARYTSTNSWSTIATYNVTEIPTATLPPAPQAAQNPFCTTTGTSLTMPTAPSGTTYYWQGTDQFGLQTTDVASTPYAVTTNGTYYVRAYDNTTTCWSNASSVTLTSSSIIPPNPNPSPNVFTSCTGNTSIPLNTNVAINTAGSLSTGFPLGSGCTNGVMFDVTTHSSALDINALTLIPNTNGTNLTVSVYYKVGTYVGSATTPTAWTSAGTYTFSGTQNQQVLVPINSFNLAENTTYGIYLDYNAVYTNITSQQTWSNNDLTITSGNGICTSFTVGNALRAPNITIHYGDDFPSIASWYATPTGGVSFGQGPLEAIGTPVMPTATAGTYDFYVSANLNGCESTERALIQVNIGSVNVELAPQRVSCHNGSDGTLNVTNIDCGTAPFTYSINGGSYGPMPTNLTPGTYLVQVKDANNQESFPLNYVIENNGIPSGFVHNYVYDTEASITWTSNSDATAWTIEWGAPGFTPGTGTEIGSAVATSTTYVITDLIGDTNYDVYVAGSCGGTLLTSSYASTSILTECSIRDAIGYCEGFEDAANMNCWKVINNNNDGDFWGINTTATYAKTGTASAQLYTDYNAGNNDDYLVLPRMLFTGNEVMKFSYRARSTSEPNDLKVVVSTTGLNPSDFNTVLLDLPSFNNTTYRDTTINLTTVSGSAYIAFYVGPGGLDGYYINIDDVCIDICNPLPSYDGAITVCRTDNQVNMLEVVTSPYTHGDFRFSPNQGLINGSNFNISTLIDGVYDINYIVTGACSADTAIASITVVGPVSAGFDGVLTACKNQLINLHGALSGTVTMGGTWYDESNTAIASPYFQTGNQIGAQTYRYIVSNGACAPDTSEVMLVIQNCDFLGLEELADLEAVRVQPNPTKGQFQIVSGEGNNFNFTVMDINGRVILPSTKLDETTSLVDLSEFENGVYIVNISGLESNKMIRVIKQ